MTVSRPLTVTTATDCATEISSVSEGYTARAVNPDVRLTEDQKLQLLEKTYLSEQWTPTDVLNLKIFSRLAHNIL